MFPWSRADFRHHVLRLVREYVPRSWRSCTRSSTSAIQTRFGVTSTPAPRGGSLRSRGSRVPCTAPCVSGAQAPAMRASRQWAPVFLRTAGGTGVRGDAEQSPSIEDSSRRPRARSQRPRCSTGGSGTTCGTKDTRPSRATQLVRAPSVSPSVGLRMRSIVPSARAALGTVKFSESVPDLADEERHAELPRIPLSPRGH